MPIDWKNYPIKAIYDELIAETAELRPAAELGNYLSSMNDEELKERKNAAELAIQVMGITFTRCSSFFLRPNNCDKINQEFQGPSKILKG